jgi:predicted GH43/DUF377 family glycosyl hydrolase
MFLTHAGSPLTYDQIIERYPIMCFWGTANHPRPMFTEYYDRVCAKTMATKGVQHHYKWNFIKHDKYANNKSIKQTPAEVRGVDLETTLIKIGHTFLIDSSKLIQSYPDFKGNKVNVTNWLNCSFIEFNNKKYFAYRMESTPFCTRMKIGLCLLDENMQPIEGSNVLPTLYSNLKSATLQGKQSFPQSFHVEDPRFFIFNEELYLSYTDGYQMAQAKINPETLQAEESFYIDKPNARRTEKNWTFFEHENKLKGVYSICPHVVLNMNGSLHKEEANIEWKHEWSWGELRGGTSPVKVGDHYLSFFHSAKSLQYRKRPSRQYFMGAYMFEACYPFTPIYISKEPLLTGELVADQIPRLNNNIFVVFPSGQIRKDNSWVVSFGYNDFECRYVEISDEMLKDNLIEIKHKMIEA